MLSMPRSSRPTIVGNMSEVPLKRPLRMSDARWGCGKRGWMLDHPATRVRGWRRSLALGSVLAQRRSPSMAPLFFRPSMAGAPLGLCRRPSWPLASPCCACSLGCCAAFLRRPSMAGSEKGHPWPLDRFSWPPSMAASQAEFSNPNTASASCWHCAQNRTHLARAASC